MNNRSNSSNFFLKKQEWKRELKKAFEKITPISDNHAKQPLETLAATIDQKITAYNGSTGQSTEIPSLLSDLNKRIETVSEWVKRMSLLQEKMKNIESEASHTVTLSQLLQKIYAYKGDELTEKEINENISELETLDPCANLHEKVTEQYDETEMVELEELGDTPVKTSPSKSSKGFSLFSLFCCCRAKDTDLEDDKSLVADHSNYMQYG